MHIEIYTCLHGYIDMYKNKHIGYLDIFQRFKMPRLNNENRNRILGLLDAIISQNEAVRCFSVSRFTIVCLVRQGVLLTDRERDSQE